MSIQPHRPVLLSCWASLAVVSAWWIAGSLALAFQCKLPMPWGPSDADPVACIDQFALQVGLGVVNIVTDIWVVTLSFSMMRGVQTGTYRKWSIIALFGLRIAYVSLHPSDDYSNQHTDRRAVVFPLSSSVLSSATTHTTTPCLWTGLGTLSRLSSGLNSCSIPPSSQPVSRPSSAF